MNKDDILEKRFYILYIIVYNHKVKRKIKKAGFTPVFYNAEGGICNYGKSCSRSKLG